MSLKILGFCREAWNQSQEGLHGSIAPRPLKSLSKVHLFPFHKQNWPDWQRVIAYFSHYTFIQLSPNLISLDSIALSLLPLHSSSSLSIQYLWTLIHLKQLAIVLGFCFFPLSSEPFTSSPLFTFFLLTECFFYFYSIVSTYTWKLTSGRLLASFMNFRGGKQTLLLSTSKYSCKSLWDLAILTLLLQRWIQCVFVFDNVVKLESTSNTDSQAGKN